VRDRETDIPLARGVKLGELLKRKAEEGVAVRILLWDDETSLPFIKNKGIMKTHDEYSVSYFKHTKVVCRLCPRQHDKFPTTFTHHQKTITTDSRMAGPASSAREIVSFVGGLDLCDGRYDTTDHSLFRTLNDESNCLDFYQTSLKGASLDKGGPREPWHDTHARVTGRAAWDVLSNFEQRWTKQCDPSLLVPTHSIRELITLDDEQRRNWNVQVFRSIDRASATTTRFSVERSIHEAYVEAIRRAERFIYVENQYFVGGCHMWEQNKNCGCGNLIPVEIALKVARKIRAGERFAAYIVVPMWPEGLPESESVQDILHWARETMKMMYWIVGEALRECGGKGRPRDYLNFFCLTNRENEVKGEFAPRYSPHHGTNYWNAQKHRRFMVYVHSKLMIVDDAYLLIGSANVNQRSMDGKRDTEIAIGCYQTRNEEKKETGNGDVREFRMSLWYEHTGVAEEIYREPQSLECVRKIRSIGDKMWKIYSEDEVQDMGGVHLVTYPVSITERGCVEDLVKGDGCFPDTKTPVKGKRSKVLSSVFTT
ncbi:Phospholipase D epsilon, partial [Striga hermonthica]